MDCVCGVWLDRMVYNTNVVDLMIYKIRQYYELVEETKMQELRYQITAIGKTGIEHGSMVCTKPEMLLDLLYYSKKKDPALEIEWPRLAVNSTIMDKIKEAYEKGWFELYPSQTPPNYTTVPTNPAIP